MSKEKFVGILRWVGARFFFVFIPVDFQMNQIVNNNSIKDIALHHRKDFPQIFMESVVAVPVCVQD